MSLSFPPINYPSKTTCCANKHTKKNPSLTRLPSYNPSEASTASLFNKPSSSRSFSAPPSTQANGIGVIGGASVNSALNFTRKLVYLQSENEESNPPFIFCSDPTLSKSLSSVRSDHSSLVENLRRKRAFLEKSGVCCIAMPCHISHCWYDEVEEGCSVPLLHLGECVAKELKEANLRPLEAGSPLRIGILSTNRNLAPSIYQEKLENEGFEVILPDKATMEHTVIPSVESLNRQDYEGAQNLFRIALQVLLVKAVNRVILASDELHDLLPLDDPLWGKCIDPMDALARSCMRISRSVETAVLIPTSHDAALLGCTSSISLQARPCSTSAK